MHNKLIITGLPRSGKSTIIEKVLAEIQNKKGFITREILEKNQRIGFEIITSDGKREILADTKNPSPYSVSRYYVHPENLSKLVPKLLEFEKEVLYIDEIGQMELFAPEFPNLVRTYLDSPNPFIGTMSIVYEHPLIQEIRKRKNIKIFVATKENRDMLYAELHRRLK